MTAFSLPNFASTEEAVRFGLTITRDQYIFLLGALAALREEFDEVRDVAGTTQLQADLATKMQLLRECLEVAPDHVLAALIPSTIRQFMNAEGGH